MPKPCNTKNLLLGAIFDAQRLLLKNETKKAYELLKRKLKEIEHNEDSKFIRVKW